LRRFLYLTLIGPERRSKGLGLTEGSLIERRKLPVCATVAETIFPFHYALIRGFRLKFVGHLTRSDNDGRPEKN